MHIEEAYHAVTGVIAVAMLVSSSQEKDASKNVHTGVHGSRHQGNLHQTGCGRKLKGGGEGWWEGQGGQGPAKGELAGRTEGHYGEQAGGPFIHPPCPPLLPTHTGQRVLRGGGGW